MLLRSVCRMSSPRKADNHRPSSHHSLIRDTDSWFNIFYHTSKTISSIFFCHKSLTIRPTIPSHTVLSVGSPLQASRQWPLDHHSMPHDTGRPHSMLSYWLLGRCLFLVQNRMIRLPICPDLCFNGQSSSRVCYSQD